MAEPVLANMQPHRLEQRRDPTIGHETTLTKGQLRKLRALRKSVGPEIGERAFAAWLESAPASADQETDPGAGRIAETLWDLVEKEDLTFPQGGYLVRRGRGRIVVEPALRSDHLPAMTAGATLSAFEWTTGVASGGYRRLIVNPCVRVVCIDGDSAHDR
jgi:hypothetical protein